MRDVTHYGKKTREFSRILSWFKETYGITAIPRAFKRVSNGIHVKNEN